MAQKPKTKNLTLEEKLEQALVPKEEQPYKIPDNWVWTRLKAVSKIVTGGTPSKNNISYYGGTFPFIKPADLDQGRHVYFATEYLSDYGKLVCRIIPKGTISVCCIGTIGKCGFLEIEATTNQQINSILPRINNLYMYYYCCSEQFVQSLLLEASATTISIINKSKMSDIIFPCAPITVQQRIVNRIESLFEKLDRAKELVQSALDSLETRKTAILHKAFTGELTAKWRKENNISLENWKNEKLKNYVDTKYGYTESACIDNIGPKFLRITDIQNGMVNWKEVPYCLIDQDNFKIYKLYKGDIVVARTGATTGKSYLIENEINAVFASYLIRISIIDTNNLFEKYLYKYMQSQMYWNQITDFSSGIAQPGVNANKLKEIMIPVPTLLEQQEIVSILDNLFTKEQRIKELCDIVDKIDLIKKSILAKAFRGELGTNDSTEESAIELLKQCLKDGEE